MPPARQPVCACATCHVYVEDGWFDRLPTTRPIAEFSVWSADLLNIGKDLARIHPHADLLHIDVADGHFAPAFLFFPDLLARVRAASDGVAPRA